MILKNKKLGLNILITLSRQLLSAFLQLGSVILVARLLGTQGMGEYSLTILIPQFLIAILNLGLPSSLVFFISSKKHSLGESVYWVNRFFLIFIPIVLAVILSLFYFFHNSWFPDLSLFLIVTAVVCIPFMLIQVVQLSVFQALEDFKKFNFLTLIQPLTFLLGISILWTIDRIDTHMVVVAFFISQFTVWLFTRIYLNRIVPPPNMEEMKSGGILRQSFKYGIKAYLANISAMISYRADLYIVGLLTNVSSAGIYAIALQISERLFIVSQAVSTVLLPRLSGTNDSPAYQTLLTSTIAKWTFFITILAGIALFYTTKWLLVPFFGEAYRASLEPMMVLIIACSFSGYARVVANALAAKNKPEWNLYIGLTAAAANVMLNLIFIPKYGIMGAAYATCISFGLNFILKILIFRYVYEASFGSLFSFKPEYNYLKRIITNGQPVN